MPMRSVPTASENFSTFIGIAKFDAPDLHGQGNRAGMPEYPGAEDEEFGEANRWGHDSFDSQVDEIDEERFLRAYWRAEEGQGLQVANVLDKQFHLVATDLEWSD